MSNLITTAQDSFRQQCIEAFVGLQSLVERMREQRQDRQEQRPPHAADPTGTCRRRWR